MIRKITPVCLCIALFKLLSGKLGFSKKYLGTAVRNKDGSVFRIFRNIKTKKLHSPNDACLFIVSFKFSRLSHKSNKLVSIIPMLIIAGFPGFIQKMYAANDENGYWQGMYEWKSKQHLEAYKKSFVFRMMNRRAIPGSVSMIDYDHLNLSEYIQQ